MDTINENIKKREYSTPLLERILIDNEISLALSSIPQPARGYNDKEEYNNENPY